LSPNEEDGRTTDDLHNVPSLAGSYYAPQYYQHST